METLEEWNARPEVVGARLVDPDMGAENRRIAPFGPCPGVEFVTLEGIVQPFPLHFHEFWTIGQIVSGARRMRCRGQVHELGPDDFVLFGPGEVHGCEPVGDEPLVYRSIVVPDKLFLQAFREARGGAGACHFRQVVVRDVVLSAGMARLYAFAWAPETNDPLEEEEALWFLLAQATKYCSDAGESAGATQPSSAYPNHSAAVERAKTLMESRFAAPLSLADLAQAAGMSHYHLIRVFADEAGLTPHRYLQAVRANRARDMLAKGIDLADVAVAVGFSDQAHLTRVYKSFYGITPGRYRMARQTAGGKDTRDGR